MKKNLPKRYFEVDALRGIAIIMMVVFHFLYNIKFLDISDLNLEEGFWMIFGRATAILFLLLVGVSLALSFARTSNPIFKKYFKRGLKIFSWGLIITLVTWLLLKEGYVRFGILHLIGVTIVLAYPLMKYKYLNLLIGVVAILIGIFVNELSLSFPWLLWLGFMHDKLVYTVDYFPVLPWAGVILIGMFIGKLLYPDYKRSFPILNISNSSIIKALSYLGKHSLIIYLIHQPIILFILFTIFRA